MNNPRSPRRLRTLAALILTIPCAPALAQPTFTPMGFLPGGDLSGGAAVSADGSVVVGSANDATGAKTVRWTRQGGLSILFPFASTPFVGSAATGISADASVVGGVNGGGQGYRWTAATGAQNLITSPPGQFCATEDVSADGSVLVGGIGSTPYRAYRWTAATGFADLGVLPGSTTSNALGASADGNIITGVSGNQAFRWTPAGGITPLTQLSGATQSTAFDISADGSTIVGSSGPHAAAWTQSGVMDLGSLPGLPFSTARDVSANGSIIVGIASSEVVLSERPWYWTPSTGMVDLVNVLGAQLPAGWRLREVFGVSADGFTIVGRGLDPLNKNQGWVVTIPSPSGAALMVLSMLTWRPITRRQRT